MGDQGGGRREGRKKEGGWTYPDVEVEVLVGYRFDVEAYCRDGGYDFADLRIPTMRQGHVVCVRSGKLRGDVP